MLDAAAESGRGLNNFDVLRLLAAASVVFAHSFLVVGDTAPIPEWAGVEYGQLGLIVFFSISGFLVARSWDYDPKLFTFAMKRILRLFPALIVVLLLTALLGLFLTNLGATAYLQDPRTKLYVLSNAVLQRDDFLPGLFESNTLKDINRSLWTIPLEFKAYILIAVLGLLGFFRRTPVAMALIGILAALLLTGTVRNWVPYANNATAFLADIQIPKTYVQQARDGALFMVLQPFAAFVIAAMLYRLRKWVPLSWWLLALGLAAWLLVATIGDSSQNTRVVATWVVPFIVLVLAYRTHTWFSLPSRMGDYSYGIYLFAFPIQQTIVHIIDPESGWVVMLITMPIVLGFAMLSWHFVEAPSLTLKQRLAPLVDSESTSAVAHPVGREDLQPVRVT